MQATDTRSTCLNCDAPLTGPFCAACGQRNIPPYPSVRELAVDAFWELSGWDGRLATTVRALVRRPGLLTREFLEGRRARYISPLRLYLVSSLAYFLLAAASPDVRMGSGKVLFAGVYLNVRTDSTSLTATGSAAAQDAMSTADKEAVLEEVENAPTPIRPFLRRAVEDPAGFQRRVFQAMPRMLFALLPVFALITALLYGGRKYPEHLYFAIHLHAYVFLALAVVEVLKFTRVPSLILGMGVLVTLSIPVYATIAFRRVYGGSLGRTLMKEVAIATIYGATSLAALVGVVYWVSISA